MDKEESSSSTDRGRDRRKWRRSSTGTSQSSISYSSGSASHSPSRSSSLDRSGTYFHSTSQSSSSDYGSNSRVVEETDEDETPLVPPLQFSSDPAHPVEAQLQPTLSTQSIQDVTPKVWCPCNKCKGKVKVDEEVAFSHKGNHGLYQPPIGETLNEANPHLSMLSRSVREFYEERRADQEAEKNRDDDSPWASTDESSTSTSFSDSEEEEDDTWSSDSIPFHHEDEAFADLMAQHFGPRINNDAVDPSLDQGNHSSV